MRISQPGGSLVCVWVSESADVSKSVSVCVNVLGNECFIVCSDSLKLDMIVGRFSGRQR